MNTIHWWQNKLHATCNNETKSQKCWAKEENKRNTHKVGFHFHKVQSKKKIKTLCGNTSNNDKTIKKTKKMNNLVIEIAVSSVGWWWGDAIIEHNVLFLKQGWLIGYLFCSKSYRNKMYTFCVWGRFCKKKLKVKIR